MDNFYTRHTLARKILQLSDNEIYTIGTVCFNMVDSVNCPCLKAAIDLMQTKERGSWCVVPAFDELDNLADLKKKHKAAQVKLPKNQRTNFTPPSAPKSEKAGYIVFVDSKVVIFILMTYTTCQVKNF